MSLVAYGTSDESDEEGSDCEPVINTLPTVDKQTTTSLATQEKSDSLGIESEVEKTGTSNCATEVEEEEPHEVPSMAKLFDCLPRPVNFTSGHVDYVASDLNVPIQKAKKVPVKISVPSLHEFEDEEEERKKPKVEKRKSLKGSKLFSMLPPPKNKCVKERGRPLVPHPVKKPTSVNLNTKQAKKPKLNVEDDDEGDEGDDQDFFSLKSSEPELPGSWAPIMVPETSSSEVVEFQEEEPAPQVLPNSSVSNTDGSLQLDTEVIKRLGGRKANPGEVNIIDISEESMLPDANEWLTKQLTVETQLHRHHSHRRNEGPTTQQRRKHQITYLAFQAKENELELKNQWSQSRMSRKQTQSKYGF